MADAKNCPVCGLVNPPHAQRCDCGYDFPTQRVIGSYLNDPAKGSPLACQLCGVEAETRQVTIHQNIGAFVMRLHSSVNGRLCKSCITQHFWGKTLVTLFVGWWGIVSFILTPFLLLNNIVVYLSCLGMKPPPAQASRSPTLPSGGSAGQLVGRNCAQCGERISCDIDGRFCQTCWLPLHNKCFRPPTGSGCLSCCTTAKV